VTRDELILAHLYLVARTRRRVVPIIPHRIEADDLESEGYLALVKAADTFDPARGTVFKSWAITKIRAALLEYLRTEDWVPRSIRDWQKRFAAAEEAIICRGEAVCWATLAAEVGQAEQYVEALWPLCQEPEQCSLDDVIRDDEFHDVTLADVTPDRAPGPEAIVLARLEQSFAASMARWLPRRERKAVLLLEGEGQTNEWTGQQLGISATGAWQVKQRGLKRVQQFARVTAGTVERT
jgi:RNA polymerase sigma factor for flagellar operon FliA